MGAEVLLGVAFGVSSIAGAGAGTGPGAVTFTASAMSTGMMMPVAIVSQSDLQIHCQTCVDQEGFLMQGLKIKGMCSVTA